MNLTVNYDFQTKQYHAKIFDGPDSIDSAEFLCDSLGGVFEKVLIFITMNGLTYCETPEEGLKSYFRSIENENVYDSDVILKVKSPYNKRLKDGKFLIESDYPDY